MHPRTLAPLLALVPAALGACKQPLGQLPAVGAAMAPFERAPYVQAVDTSSAVIRWLARDGVENRAEYRVGEDGDWIPLPVQASDSAFVGVSGLVRTRSVRITGLLPDSEVWYRVRAGEVERDPVRFRTAPPPGRGDTVAVLAFGDSGWGSEEQFALADRMLDGRYDLALHTGDIAYQVGSEFDFTLRHFQVYGELLAGVPMFPAPGNHDLRTDGGAPYDAAFEWPAPEAGARFYSYRWGDILFLVLDTTDEEVPEPEDVLTPEGRFVTAPETDGHELRRRRGRQYEWLLRELGDSRGDPGVRWIIAYMHHPPYSHAVGLSGHGSDIRLQRAVSPLFEEYGVDLVLAGHDHHYERTRPVRGRWAVADGCGPVYIVTGGGGASRLARAIAPTGLLAISSREHHFVRLAITEDRVIGEAVGERGQTIDAFRILPFDGLGPDGEPASPACGD